MSAPEDRSPPCFGVGSFTWELCGDEGLDQNWPGRGREQSIGTEVTTEGPQKRTALLPCSYGCRWRWQSMILCMSVSVSYYLTEPLTMLTVGTYISPCHPDPATTALAALVRSVQQHHQRREADEAQLCHSRRPLGP